MTETINFHDFMRNDYKKIKKVDYKMLSLSPFVISPSTWLSPPPLVAKGYAVVIGLGLIMIVAAQIEMVLADRDFTGLAGAISDFFKVAMPLVFIAALVLFVMFNPLL